MNSNHSVAETRRPSRWKRRAGVALILFVFLSVVSVFGAAIYSSSQLAEGKRLAKKGRWSEAEAALSRYLRLRQSDHEARMLLAESLVRSSDAAKEPDEVIESALAVLAMVPDDAPQAAEARLRAARLVFLLQRRPAAAEQLLRRAISLDPDSYPAHVLLWRVLDMTRRPEAVEPVFWRVMRLAPASKRLFHLRDWYFSQFAPAPANFDLDREMGFVPTAAPPDATLIEFIRYRTFREQEPGTPMHYTAEAKVLYFGGDYAAAMQVLDEAPQSAAWADPSYVALRAEVALELGEVEEFRRCVEHWPEPAAGFSYWEIQGIYHEEVEADPAGALEAFDRALAEWPGPIDWSLTHRKANCLRRLGRVEAAEQTQQRAIELEKLIAPDYQKDLRRAVTSLNDPESLDKLAAFYQEIGREKEATLWQEYAASVRYHTPAPILSF